MKRINFALLASVASMALASGAHAQPTPLPTPGLNDGDAQLHGAGATAVTEIVDDEILWLESNESDFEAQYLPTGSGAGRQAWRSNTTQLSSFGSPFNTWDTVQFAFSESGTSATELSQYNTNLAAYGLKPIFVPKFVLPVAIAYNPVYATEPDTTTPDPNDLIEWRFQVNSGFAPGTTQIGGVNVGGLRLTRALVCNIFNGTITNWNHTDLTAANGGVSLGNASDANFTANGAPIRLVGRMDRSGTTDIFTRALAAQCPTVTPAVTNYYLTNAEALPYNRGGSVPDFSLVRGDTPYSGGSTAPLAGTFNLIGADYFNGTTITTANVTGTLTVSTPAAGASGTGLFLMADGSARVAGAIAMAPDIVGTAGYKVNGKVGYIGADFIANAVNGNPNLFAAALNRPGAPNTWHLPSSTAATAAFGAILPPDSVLGGGGVFNPAGALDRTQPLDWYRAIYPTALTGLPMVTTGYPITGVSSMALHTCYKTTNEPNIQVWLGYNVGKPRGVTNTTFTDPSTGLMAAHNIGAVHPDWQHAIYETFLTNSTESAGGQRLGALDLWIEAAGSNHCAGVSTLPGETLPGM